MNKTKLILSLLMAFACIMLVACARTLTGEAVKESTAIKIGAINPMSGPLAVYGLEYSRGIKMAVEEINAEGGINGKPIEVIYEDDKGDPKESATIANRLIYVEKTPIILTSMSSTTQATAPIANNNRIVMISATVTKVGDIGEYVFRDYWDMEEQGVALGQVIKEKGYKKVGIIAIEWADYPIFMRGLKSVIGDDVELKEEKFNFGDADFRTQLTKLKAFDPDVILLYSFPGNELINIVQQIFELDMQRPLLDGATGLGWGFMTEALVPLLKQTEVIANWYGLSPEDPKVKDFKENYEQRYQEPLNGDAAYTYDDIYALKTALEACDAKGKVTDTDCIRDELLKTDLDGIAGRLVFDKNGNSEREWFLQTYTEDGWKEYAVQE